MITGIWNMIRGRKPIPLINNQSEEETEENHNFNLNSKRVEVKRKKPINNEIDKVITDENYFHVKEKINNDVFKMDMFSNILKRKLNQNYDENSLRDYLRSLRKNFQYPYVTYLFGVFLRRKWLYGENVTMDQIIKEEWDTNVNEEYVAIHLI